jgi:TonB family protein
MATAINISSPALRNSHQVTDQVDLRNWVVLTLIVHILIIAGLLKLARMSPPLLIPKANAIILMLDGSDASGGSSGSSASSAAAGQLLKQHKVELPRSSTPQTHPAHELKSTPVPTPTRIAHILPQINTPSPIWMSPEPSQNAAKSENASAAGRAASTQGSEGGQTAGQEQGNGAGAGNSAGTSNGLGTGTGHGLPGNGNIGPYRKYLLLLISRRWRPTVKPVDIVLRLKIAKRGELLATEVYQSSGNPKADNEALKAARSVKYPPLPRWFDGNSLTFQFQLTSSGAKK